MNQEIEYAEMLEIPVSTVNVVKKSRRRRKTRNETPAVEPALQPAPSLSQNALKDTVIAQVNDKLTDEPFTQNPEAELYSADGAFSGEGQLDFDVPDRIDTVRLYSTGATKKRGLFSRRKLRAENYHFEENSADENAEFSQNEGGRYEFKHETGKQRAFRIALNAEFALTCALCGAIFLTNVFMPESAINTFFRSMNNSTVEASDNRHYSEFTLASIVSELSDTTLNLSSSGVLSFTDECCVYPAANGKISEVVKEEDGTYLVRIAHSDTFTGVIDGLDYVYYSVGDDVYSNVPVGFSKGETEVQVTMYSEGELLSCFSLTEENCLAWTEQV